MCQTSRQIQGGPGLPWIWPKKFLNQQTKRRPNPSKKREGPNILATLSASVPPSALDDGRRPPAARAGLESCLLPGRLCSALGLRRAPPPARRPPRPASCSGLRRRSTPAEGVRRGRAPLPPLRAGTWRAAARVRPRQVAPGRFAAVSDLLTPPEIPSAPPPSYHSVVSSTSCCIKFPQCYRFYQSQCGRAQFL